MDAPRVHRASVSDVRVVESEAELSFTTQGLLSLLGERVDRNRDVVTSHEQAMLQSARILIAGCGSVGGSAVEPLVRMGLGSLVLADPEEFDLSNINRQGCTMSDIGRNKAAALESRALAINPLVETRALLSGITEENVANAILGVGVVFDGIDAGAAPVEKYLLHAQACANRIPVMAGMDFGGKAVLYVFDYRKKGAKPFYGMTDEKVHRERNFSACLRWLGYRHFPADFLPIITDRLASKRPWPQVAYCVQAMGALSSRCALDLLMGRKVPHVISIDTHMKMRRHMERLREYAGIPLRLIAAVRTSRNSGDQRAISSEPASRSAALLSDQIVAVLDAMRLAPSPHNCQPWLLDVQSGDTLEVRLRQDRPLPYADPNGNGSLTSLGCAVEAAASVADLSIDVESFSSSGGVGIIQIQRLRPDRVWRNLALLRRRTTNRHRYLTDPIPQAVRDECIRASADLHGDVLFDQPDVQVLRKLVKEGAKRQFRQPAYVDELLSHLRFTEEEEARYGYGMTPRGLALDRGSALALRLLRAVPTLRSVSMNLGLPTLMAVSAARCVPHTGTFVLITGRDTSPVTCISAGRVLMRTWLELTRHGFACQPLDFPIGFEDGREEVLRLFRARKGDRPIALLRVGRPTFVPPPSAPRVDIQRLLAGKSSAMD